MVRAGCGSLTTAALAVKLNEPRLLRLPQAHLGAWVEVGHSGAKKGESSLARREALVDYKPGRQRRWSGTGRMRGRRSRPCWGGPPTIFVSGPPRVCGPLAARDPIRRIYDRLLSIYAAIDRAHSSIIRIG
jgi:hypothetical protein